MVNQKELMSKIVRVGELFHTATLINCVAVNLIDRELISIPEQSMENCFCWKINACISRETNLDHVFVYCSRPTNLRKQSVYHCPYGFTNIIVPIAISGEIRAGLLAGPILNRCPEQIINFVNIPGKDIYKDTGRNELKKYKYYDINQIVALSELLVLMLEPVEKGYEQKGMEHDNVGNNFSITIRMALEYIKNHYHENITLGDVARAVYVNPSYLSRIFNREVKTSFSAYLNKYRIEKSKMLLAERAYSIVDVCLLVGFENQSYYNKVFKQVEGATPSQFRKKMCEVDDKITVAK